MDSFKKAEDTLRQLEKDVAQREKKLWKKFHSLESKKAKVDDELLKDFLEEYWYLYPGAGSETWYLAVPKCFQFTFGWLDHSTKGYNVFKIDKYSQWTGGELPEFLRKQVKLPTPMKIQVSDGNVTFEQGEERKVKDQFGSLLSEIGRGSARVKRGKEFDLIAQIIDSGSLPFVPHPVDKKDLRETDLNFTTKGKFSFQEDAYETFLKHGAMGIYWMTGAGKSFLAMKVADSLKGHKFMLVPSKTLIEQWTEYFKKYAPRLLHEVDIFTYQGMHKLVEEMKKKKYVLGMFDECHVLPANTFSRSATLPMTYRLGLSATPYREDGRTNLIMALTGYPWGLNWQSLMKILGKHYHDVTVYIVANETAKVALVSNLLNKERKTLIFVNELAIGEKIANMIGVPFIHGATRNRMQIARESKIFVASRVMGEGISIKDLEHIIEPDFLFGSGREELQRTGRLMHSEIGKTHDIIMTPLEFEKYGHKRLRTLKEKGFYVRFKPMVAGTFKLVRQEPSTKKGPQTKMYSRVVESLYSEGFFHTPKKLGDVKAELERRGVPGSRTTHMTWLINSKLNQFVRSKKLYKDGKRGKKTYIMRGL